MLAKRVIGENTNVYSSLESPVKHRLGRIGTKTV